MSGATVERLAWDSAFFGVQIAQIKVDRGERWDLEGAIEACRSAGVQCVYLLLDAADAHGSEAAQALGFVVRDVRVELDRRIALSDAAPAAGSNALVLAGSEHLPMLEALVRERVTMSRFFADPRFPRERCRELYVEFLRRGCEGSPRRWALTTEDGAGCIVGHVDARRCLGTIELVVARRPGAGSALVRAAIARFATSGMTASLVVTQAQNIAAQRAYQHAGFRTARTGLWLHRWLDV